MLDAQPGRVVLLGSGETSPNIRKTYDWLFRQMNTPVQAAILETPAGFEPNSADVAGQIGTYIQKHLQNYTPQISIIPARKRGTSFSTDDPAILEPMFGADLILLGPGSPTYAVRQLQDSLTWHSTRACQRMGKTLVFASAATLACSQQTIPVYEIYKVGEDLHWKRGLDFFGSYGLSLVFVPHWNNNDGGETLDTSRCYMGKERFGTLVSQLDTMYADSADGYTIVGLDENTALIVDFVDGSCQVMGQGGVVIIRGETESSLVQGKSYPLQMLGPFQIPANGDKIPTDIWTTVQGGIAEAQAAEVAIPVPPKAVLTLMEERENARLGKDWARSDTLRDEIENSGWTVRDTREGPVLEPLR